MNEYDPVPKHVLPLNYAVPAPRQADAESSFVLGCTTSLCLLIGLPIFFGIITKDASVMGFGFVAAVAIIIGGIVWAFIRGKRAFGRGMIWGPLMIVCVILLLAGVCALMVFGVGNIGK